MKHMNGWEVALCNGCVFAPMKGKWRGPGPRPYLFLHKLRTRPSVGPGRRTWYTGSRRQSKYVPHQGLQERKRRLGLS